MQIYTSGEVARMLGMRRAKLIYMEETGKIPLARRTGTLKRYFTDADIRKLKQGLSGTKRAENV